MLLNLSPHWKEIIKFYLTDCFLFDIYSRKMDNKLKLLSKREVLYEVVDDPLLLNFGCHFDNNLVKNFCSGLANFIKLNYTKIVAAMERDSSSESADTVSIGVERNEVVIQD